MDPKKINVPPSPMNVLGGPRDGEKWPPGTYDKQVYKLNGHKYYWHEERQRWIYIGTW